MTAPSDVAMIGGPDNVIDGKHVARFIADQLAGQPLDGRSVCVLVPDPSRTCPLPLLLTAVHEALHSRVSRLTVLIALGTHAPMTEPQLARHLGYPEGGLGTRYPGMSVRNHAWQDPDTFVSVGVIPGDRVAELSEGRLREPVDVRLNSLVVDHDVTLIVGPVFPHEVVGFSGGTKYLFPGIAGQEIIDLSHWLGALITSAAIIGTPGTTPVRALIDEAAAMVPTEQLALCVVVKPGSGELYAAAFGEPRAAWARAAEVSAGTHVRYLDEPVRRVVAVIPEKYDDMWTAAKGFYKVEPVVADGGEVIIYAPHITRLSAMHPEIEEIGYHCRDFFLQQWERYRQLHWGVLAHSTHLRGVGTFEAGREWARVRVTLATAIPEQVVRAANLDYLDPTSLDLAAAHTDPATFVVPDAGEVLFRLSRPATD